MFMSTSKKYKIYTHRSRSAPPFIQIPESDLCGIARKKIIKKDGINTV